MQHNLFVNFYTDKNPKRSKELDFCLIQNVTNPAINSVVVICKEQDWQRIKEIFPVPQQDVNGVGLKIRLNDYSKKIVPIVTDVRPTFNDYFRLMTRLYPGQENINIIANLDIIIPYETLEGERTAKDYLTSKNKCLALCRWDSKSEDYREKAKFLDFVDSQDSWFFVGGVEEIPGVDFTLGTAGCDNSICHHLTVSGREVLNPSRTLKTYHLHVSDVRNYTQLVGNTNDIYRIPPPHRTLEPTH